MNDIVAYLHSHFVPMAIRAHGQKVTMNRSVGRCARAGMFSHLNVNLTTKTLLFSVLASVATICASADTHPVIVVDPHLPKSAKSILDLRIEKIDLSGVTMNAALLEIADAVYRSSGGKLHFSFAVGFAKAEVEKYVRRRIPEDKWKLRDPRIHVRTAKTTLRDVVEQLCDQSGWSYKSTPIGIAFIDDGSYFNQKR
jgi:hypothetical protein